VLTLSLTNTSTQNTQIYQVATSNPTTSYTAIQASHVSTGTTNNALVINPSGGNVGVGTTAPSTSLHVLNPTLQAGNTTMVTAQIIGRPATGGVQNGMSGGFAIGAANAGINSVGRMDMMVTSASSAGNAFGYTPDVAVMTLLGSGNVGVGTTAPLYQFQVRSGGSGATGSSIPTTTIGSFVRLLGYLTTDRVDIEIGSSATDIGDIGCTYKYRLGMAGTGTTAGASFQISGVAISGSYTGTDIVTPRFTILPSGNVGLSVTNPGYRLALDADSAAKPATNTWTISSDARLKTDIQLADTNRCVEIIKAVPLKRYTWKDNVYTMDQVKDRSKLGWIAQDVEAVFPKAVGQHRFSYNQKYEDVVKEDGTVTKTLVSEDILEDCRDLNADQIYAVMYGAVQSLIQKNEEKDAKISSLIAWAQTMGYSASS